MEVGMDFVHRPRPSFHNYEINTSEYKVDVKNNLGGESEKYAHLSPFAFWSLFIDPATNSELDLTDVEQVELEFEGEFLIGITS